MKREKYYLSFIIFSLLTSPIHSISFKDIFKKRKRFQPLTQSKKESSFQSLLKPFRPYVDRNYNHQLLALTVIGAIMTSTGLLLLLIPSKGKVNTAAKAIASVTLTCGGMALILYNQELLEALREIK